MAKRTASQKSVKQRRQEAAQKQAAQKRQQRLILTIVGAIALVIIGWFAWQNLQPEPEPTVLEGERPLTAIAPAERNGYYDAVPEMIIDTAKNYEALLTMENGGEIRLALFDDEAPLTVNNFVFLANEGYYDGTTFHRVLPNFMAQGGDPSGTGAGGPGYNFADEVDSGFSFDRPGLLAMANAGPNTNGSQFFITTAPVAYLDGLHTIFGEVTGGEDALNNITLRDPQSNPDFTGDVIARIEILEVN